MNFLNDNKDHYIVPGLIVLLYIVFVITNMIIQKDISLFMDDLSRGFVYPEEFNKFWQIPDHGSHFTSSLNILLGYYLPKWLNCHPQTFISGPGLFIRSLLFVAMPLTVASFAFAGDKKNILYPVIFVLSFFAVFNAGHYCFSDWAMQTAFLRMFLPIVIFGYFWYSVTRSCLNDTDFGKFLLIILCTAGFLTGNSSEFLSIISAIMLICLCFIYVFCDDESGKIVFATAKDKFVKFAKRYTLPFVSLILGLIPMICNQEFHRQIQIKYDRFPDVTLANTLPLFPEFVGEYCKYIIADHWVVLYFILIMSFLLLLIAGKQRLKTIYITGGYVFSLLFVYFCLFFLGKTHYHGGFWIVHPDLNYCLQIMLLMFLMIPTGALLCELAAHNSASVKKFLTITITVIFAFVFLRFTELVPTFMYKTKQLRQMMYSYDKMSLLYWLNKEKAIVPYDYAFSNFWVFINLDSGQLDKNIKEDDVFHQDYAAAVYKYVKFYGYEYTESREAMNKFKEKDGVLTREELRQTDFEQLRDPYFILNLE